MEGKGRKTERKGERQFAKGRTRDEGMGERKERRGGRLE